MAWIRWNLLLSIGLFVSPVFVSAEQQSQSSFRRLYVLQPGPGPGQGLAGADGVRVSSISSRPGAAGQPHSYNVELTASFGGQIRTRRMGNQANPIPQFAQHQSVVRHSSSSQTGHPQNQQSQQMKLTGVNVCGGQCCHGWSKAQGSQRCTKPNCIPQCQNGGMCLRPQLCVCKPGSKGKACEQKTAHSPPFPAVPGNTPTNGNTNGHSTGHSNGHTTGHTNGHTNGHNMIPQRPIPQQVPPQGYTAPASPSVSNMAQMRLTVKQAPQLARPQYIQQQVRPMHLGQSQQYVIKPKYYHTHTTHTQTHVQPQPERPIPLTVGHNPIHVGNHTGRIKVVFTPTICKVTCTGGRCHNNCELGNTTTIISENGHATDTLTAPNFRVVVCHLPCMNGGKCSARDKCQCPPNFTGKFCQVPIQNGHQQHPQTSGSYSQTQVYSTHTLPLTYNNGQNPVKFSPSIVNIHIKHPPEASVQIHQVSQLDSYHHNGHTMKGSQSGSSSSTSYSYHHAESSQKIQHHGHNMMYPSQHGYQPPQYQPVTSKSQLGRCFQETTGSQCGKALPGLSKQEDCCGTIGTSWGFHKCQKCPKNPSIPLLDCPQGYKRINSSHCQDVNECQLQGVCPNGDCMNAIGSYRCICKPGYIPDPTLSTCIPNMPAIQEEKGACFRLVSSGRQCLHPVSAQLSKQLCCCSVGKAWGPHCDKCPPPGTAKFKEICPGGMGYTVLPKPPVNKPAIPYQEPVALPPPQPLPTPEKPVEAFGKQEEVVPVVTAAPDQELVVPVVSDRPVIGPILPQLSPGVFTVRMETAFPEVVERSSPPTPVEILPSNAGQDIAPTQSAEVDECQINPHICGGGVCYNTAEGYTCHCDEGFRLDNEHNTCVDVDECLTPYVCPEGETCLNTIGSFQCRGCERGFRLSHTGVCEDIDECLDLATCANGKCTNFEGSFTCSCNEGFQLLYGESCHDIDECENELLCTRGHCQNTEGSFICACEPGFRASAAGDQCEDVDECVEEARPCEAEGQCVNNMGSYTCNCPQGYKQINGTSCVDVDECVDELELCSPHGECVNTEGSYQCVCDSGFVANPDTHFCDDIDECEDELLCTRGHCQNTEGSFICACEPGFRASAAGDQCEDIDECGINETVCGPHGYCENRVGSFRCLCEQGYQESQDGHGCVDVNECELLSSVCGEAQCENVEGTFLCLCPNGQEYNPMTAKCNPVPTVPPVERKDCFYPLNDENLCENVLTSHITLQECCCTLGAGWGDNCEVHPCPVNDTDQFNQICPSGRGYIPIGDSVYGIPTPDSYKDADECALFGQEVCKGGFCLDTLGSYECYCKTGHDYDPAKLECRDINECLDESVCAGRECLNTDGSYMCFCSHPMELDPVSNRCVLASDIAVSEHRKAEQVDYLGICWQTLTDSMTCTQPLGPNNRKTTYTECCCLYGEAWGMDCALCPPRNTEDYASMCNLPMGAGRRPYGRDALVAGPVHEYEVSPDYAPSPDQQAVLPLYEEEERPYQAFEGLRAEECGILNGCENGRCVRVQEGYTCDCFDGYTLDMSRMACIDVNECLELNTRMVLCKNAKCINTQGSYQCVCLPGFTTSEKPNYCVEATTHTAPTTQAHTQ
ncbi:latent-transforming growth factor beta-binding protein 1 isoform X3 [Myripristis murdjan]|uniref:latent-transforming growth factor beta-binding protein 1 isoform X3 n=1 Tax=Myripristis murdjan TaxID=586833 RepID=UPI001175CDD2|nr:latent-transforming growth factor beta-binding protein 1 isoform X3 [Myripristis murdjan]